MDMGGAFVARNVTIFQAALLQPEEYYPMSSDGSISGKHTGDAFVTLVGLFNKYNDEKSIFLNQDFAGRTVLHTLATTRNEQTDTIEKLLRDSLANEPEIQKKLWDTCDKQGKRYNDLR